MTSTEICVFAEKGRDAARKDVGGGKKYAPLTAINRLFQERTTEQDHDASQKQKYERYLAWLVGYRCEIDQIAPDSMEMLGNAVREYHQYGYIWAWVGLNISDCRQPTPNAVCGPSSDWTTDLPLREVYRYVLAGYRSFYERHSHHPSPEITDLLPKKLEVSA